MPRRVLDLASLEWHLGRAPRQPFCPRPIDDRGMVSGWLPSSVPGDIRGGLLAAGHIPPLDTPEGVAEGTWVDAQDWWLSATLPEHWAGDETVVLEADGIDYQSALWLDHRLMATRTGMFSRQVARLSPWINHAGAHQLAVRIWGGGSLARAGDLLWRRPVRRLIDRLLPGTEFFPDRLATVKAQYSFGWDFSPRVLSAGIWDEIRLVACRGAYLEDTQIIAEPLTESEDPTPVRWRVRPLIRRFHSNRLFVTVDITPVDASPSFLAKRVRVKKALAGTPGEELTVEAVARRWWPWDQGEPVLYRVTVTLADERGAVDEISVLTGARSVRRERLPGGAPWRFTVNGRAVFLRGANWVPSDVLPGRITGDEYERLQDQARECGINFLRVWGGGLREKRAFWDGCDRRGILAWHEFPLACSFLDHYPRDPSYLGLLEQEARGTVRLLRNHPSLLAWCGGNEINPKRERIPLNRIAAVLAQEDTARPFIPASPGDGDIHQWDVWHGGAPWEQLGEERAPFMSEFGLQALPDLLSMREMFGGGPPPVSDTRWQARKAQPDKLREYGGPAVADEIALAVAASQRAQAAALQVGIEGCRRRRDKCGGVAFWQFNEPWPAISWSVIDKAGRPKLAYERLRLCYQPVLVAARFSWRAWRASDDFHAEIWLVNDGPDAHMGCTIVAKLDGRLVWRLDGATLAAASAVCAGTLAVTLAAPPVQLSLALNCGGEPIARNMYDLAVYRPPKQSLIRWLRRRVSDRLVAG